MKPMRVDGGDNKFLYAALICFGLAAILAVLIALGGCSLKSQQIALVGLQGGDLVSTAYAESRGGVEANPVMRVGWPSRIVLKTLSTVGVVWIAHEISKRGHETFAKGLLYALNGAMAIVVVNNLSVARGQ